MYVKPQMERFGSVRELTQIGVGQDCDGGIHGLLDGWPCIGGGGKDRS